MRKVTLYNCESSDIKITIESYFDGENLVIEGYDIGKRVEDIWGDSDYEYVTKVDPEELNKLYPLLNVPVGDKDGLLNAIADNFNTNTCYSKFQDFLEMNGIKAAGYSWA